MDEELLGLLLLLGDDDGDAGGDDLWIGVAIIVLVMTLSVYVCI